MPALTTPVADTERVAWIDALRGFALLGIIVANLESSMLRFLLPGKGHDLGPLASLNVPFEFFESALIQGKFYSIFSFLFGLGFSIQMMRAAEREASSAPSSAAAWRRCCSSASCTRSSGSATS